MKISPKKFAEMLFILTDGKSLTEGKENVKKFAAFLFKSGQLKNINKIIEEFGKVWNREKGIVEAEVVSAKELDKDILKFLQEYVAKWSGAQEVIIKSDIDKSLLGGVKIKYEDKVVDASLKTRIEDLKNSFEK